MWVDGGGKTKRLHWVTFGLHGEGILNGLNGGWFTWGWWKGEMWGEKWAADGCGWDSGKVGGAFDGVFDGWVNGG